MAKGKAYTQERAKALEASRRTILANQNKGRAGPADQVAASLRRIDEELAALLGLTVENVQAMRRT